MTGEIDDSPSTASPAPPDVVTVKQSRSRREGLFGFLTVALALALGRGAAGAHTTTGRIVAVVVFGALLAVIVGGWLRLVLRPSHIEVSPQRIRYVAGTGESRPDVMRNRGDEVTIYARQSGRIGSLYLEQRGTTISWSLPLFSRQSVELACRSQGWRVVDIRRRVPPVS